MSERTPCNHCKLESMKREAAKQGATVIVEQIPYPDEMYGWYSARYSDENEPSAYFMSLTVGCAC